MTLFQNKMGIVTTPFETIESRCSKAKVLDYWSQPMDLPWWKQEYRGAMDGYCFGSMETQKEWEGEIPNFKRPVTHNLENAGFYKIRVRLSKIQVNFSDF